MKKLLLTAFISGLGFLYAQDSLNMNKVGHLTYTPILNDVWGWVAANGDEYALVGTTTGLSVVDVSNPAQPQELHFESGAYSTWRDIKTFGNYAYVVHDSYSGTSDGIMIVDLSTANSVNPVVYRRFPIINLNGNTYNFTRAHNIFIDENGVLYVFGAGSSTGGIGAGGALMFDLNADPTNPAYLGAYDQYYLHDGMVRGDTLWGGAIYQGSFVAVDVSNKSNPQLMGSHPTPHSFTHNIWVSDDNKTVFTTDEIKDAYVTAYDVSDLANIQELDRIQTSISNDVIPHNTHVLGDFLVTSYYTSGVQLVDATVPGALIETAYYDTSPFSGDGFEGNWGVYPYLPSTNLLVSDREQGLFIISSSFPRGAYFNGVVIDSITRNPIPNAQLEIINTSQVLQTKVNGTFTTAVLNGSLYPVVVTKSGYTTDTVYEFLVNGVQTTDTIALLQTGFSVGEGENIKAGLSPVPSINSLNIDIPAFSGSELNVQIIDISGRQISNHQLSLSNGKAELKHNLSPGVYTLIFSNNRENIAPQKFIVK